MIAAPSGKRQVLVVEDDRISRHALARLLELAGFEVSCASTVSEACQKLAHVPDWVILDLDLPDGDGADVLCEMRRRGLDIGVIIASACGDTSILLKAMSLGADAILEKPIEIGQLLRWLHRQPKPFPIANAMQIDPAVRPSAGA